MERKPRQINGLYVLYVLSVIGAKNNVGYSGSLCGKNLLLYPAHRKDLASQRDFTGHCKTRPDRPPGKSGENRHAHGYASRGPILRYRTLRHMDMELTVLETFGFYTIVLRAGLDNLRGYYG